VAVIEDVEDNLRKRQAYDDKGETTPRHKFRDEQL
jgi:hypothetical protein